VSTPEQPSTASASPINVDHISRWYGDVVAVNDVSFDVGAGITGLLGPNGAGKTTLLHMIAGLLAPSAGEARINGAAAWGDPAVYRNLGLVPERETVHPFLTGREFALVNAVEHGLADPDGAAERAIAAVEMQDAAGRRIGTYSKGMRQRIKMAAALVHDPEVLVLDEPFNGMDPRQRLQMFELLQRMGTDGRTVLLSSHILEEVERIADSVLVIYAGRLAASGDFRSIRRLMTDRPHVFHVRSNDDRRLAALLVGEPCVFGVELTPKGMEIRTSDYGAFTSRIAIVSRDAAISLRELRPTDDSLESVFGYLVGR
jgi:ABC-2 type transport system ATP-binding protein